MTTAKLNRVAFTTVINKDSALADGSRHAGDYDNSTNLALFATAYLTVQWDTTAPSANTLVGDLYNVPGDGETTETFPAGGDGTVGSNHTPSAEHFIGSFETINPSISVDEVIALANIPLSPDTNRFVLVNTSGQQFDLTYQVDLKIETIDQA